MYYTIILTEFSIFFNFFLFKNFLILFNFTTQERIFVKVSKNFTKQEII